jgi:hypothetical protein
MLAAARVLLSVALASGSTGIVTIRAADRDGTPASTLPLGPDEVGWLGTWSGTIAVEGVPEPFDGGYIAIDRIPGGRLGVTVGPEAEVRYTGGHLERTERGLRFDVSLPGIDTRLLAYDVEIIGGRMTGVVTFVRYRLTKPGRLDFQRD